jgi:hypothetical protein
MNKYIPLLAVGLLLVTGCSPDPVTVVEQFQDAVNSQNIEGAIELLAEDAVLQVDGSLSRTGKAETENWLATQAELNFRIEGDPASSESGVSIESCSISSNQWLYFGVNPMIGTCEVALEGGLINSFAIRFDENSKARLSDSPAAVSADLVEIWTGRWVVPEGSGYVTDDNVTAHLQFVKDGSARLAHSAEDLLIPPDTDHPGARLTWTYEDYMLTLQNQGSASEGYCQVQDVGTYLVKNTRENGIEIKLISDQCAFRANSLPRLGAIWRPYVP